MKVDLPFVKAYQDRHKRWRYYFRRTGFKTVALPGEPLSEEFMAAYTEARDGPKPPPMPVGVVAGSFDALCREWVTSAQFGQFAPSTRREMGYVVESLRKDHGAKPVAKMRRKHIVEMKDKLASKPGAANKMLRTIKMLLAYAVEKEYLDNNPARSIKLMKLGRFRAWTDAELDTFEECWKLGTVERMIFDLALYTGQRRADLAKLKRTQVHGPYIIMRQQKTGKDLIIRVHQDLRESMDTFLPCHKAETIIAGPGGETISPVYMAAIFRRACRTAKLPTECVLHGLRKTFSRIQAENNQKSAPITGHRTRAMQDEYERDANQKKMGDATILAWEKSGRKRHAS